MDGDSPFDYATRGAIFLGYLGYGEGGRHWERDLMVQYRVAEGPAKGLCVALMHNSHRANAAQAELDTDPLRLALEYPLGGTFQGIGGGPATRPVYLD